MSDYKETTLSGSSWQRCHQIVIDNPRGGVPTVRFDEEETLAINGDEIKRPMGQLALAFDPARSFDLRNPITGELIPGAASTYGDVYVLLYSAYMAAALERDTPPVQPIQGA